MTFGDNVINIAKSYVGFHEGPNNQNPFTLWQTGFTSLQPWCDSFVVFCAYQAGFRFPGYSLFGAKGDWNVGAHHTHAVREGIWRWSGGYVASRGDLVVLNFGEVDQHIEIVDVDMGPGHYPRCVTIGGNTGDQVAWRSRYPANVEGFIALTLVGPDPQPGPGPTPPPPPPKVEEDMQSLVDEVHPGVDGVHPRTINVDSKGNIFVNGGIKLKHAGKTVKVVKIGSRWIAPSNADTSKLEYQGHVARKDDGGHVSGIRQFFYDDKDGLQVRDYDFFQ